MGPQNFVQMWKAVVPHMHQRSVNKIISRLIRFLGKTGQLPSKFKSDYSVSQRIVAWCFDGCEGVEM